MRWYLIVAEVVQLSGTSFSQAVAEGRGSVDIFVVEGDIYVELK
jgi:hypothetical protein